MPNFKSLRNKPKSKFLTGNVDYSLSRECLGSCLAMERSVMKSSMLFECEPLPYLASTSHPPDVVHMMSVPRPFPFFFFAALPLPGTRLP